MYIELILCVKDSKKETFQGTIARICQVDDPENFDKKLDFD
jgi:hypothetical protein